MRTAAGQRPVAEGQVMLTGNCRVIRSYRDAMKQDAVERQQPLPCTNLAHHEPASIDKSADLL